VKGKVMLNGTLICTSQEEVARVIAGVEAHIALTRTEAGCISFEVLQSDDPMIWTVSETFTDAAAFQEHQTRASASAWAELTKGIARDYQITGLE
tara:strand:- start:80 stop:364 length:285 start_codon:yes stop_codon:yes gene_type:complete